MSPGLERALALLRGGGVVGIPTDTQFGLAADGLNEAAVRRVFEAKGRPSGMALPLLLPCAASLGAWSSDLPEIALKLAERYWPGALTLIVRKAACVPGVVTGGLDTVALRVPDHPVPRALCRGLARPITGTSANATGQTPLASAEGVRRELGAWIDYVVDGTAPGGPPSTIVDVTGSRPRVTREGAIPASDLAAFLEAALHGKAGP